MAGLLDIFGSGNSNLYGGLLGEEDLAQAKRKAQSDALLNLSASLFKAGGPSRTPQGLGLGLVEGLRGAQSAYGDTMKSAVQEKLLQQKIAQEQQALQRSADVNKLIQGAYQPAQPGQAAQQPSMIGGAPYGMETPAVPATPANFNLQSIIPQLMTTAEGRQALTGLQAMTKPEMFNVAEGATQYERDPMTGQVRAVAQGAPKTASTPSSFTEFKLASQDPNFAAFLSNKAAQSAPRVSVDLNDETAVAKAQADILKDWRGVVKDSGAFDTAVKFENVKAAVAEGNAGNKAADGALIYAIGKIYDPSGAVQEGDKATILGNRSIPDGIKSYAQKAFSGQDLLPEERANLFKIVTKIVEAKAAALDKELPAYASLSRQLGGTGDLLTNPLASVLSGTPIKGSANNPTIKRIGW